MDIHISLLTQKESKENLSQNINNIEKHNIVMFILNMMLILRIKVRARVRRGADPHQSSPMKALNLFQVNKSFCEVATPISIVISQILSNWLLNVSGEKAELFQLQQCVLS